MEDHLLLQWNLIARSTLSIVTVCMLPLYIALLAAFTRQYYLSRKGPRRQTTHRHAPYVIIIFTVLVVSTVEIVNAWIELLVYDTRLVTVIQDMEIGEWHTSPIPHILEGVRHATKLCMQGIIIIMLLYTLIYAIRGERHSNRQTIPSLSINSKRCSASVKMTLILITTSILTIIMGAAIAYWQSSVRRIRHVPGHGAFWTSQLSSCGFVVKPSDHHPCTVMAIVELSSMAVAIISTINIIIIDRTTKRMKAHRQRSGSFSRSLAGSVRTPENDIHLITLTCVLANIINSSYILIDVVFTHTNRMPWFVVVIYACIVLRYILVPVIIVLCLPSLLALLLPILPKSMQRCCVKHHPNTPLLLRRAILTRQNTTPSVEMANLNDMEPILHVNQQYYNMGIHQT